MQSVQISESTADGYVKALFQFARSSFEETGRGLVVIREGYLTREPDGRIEATAQYSPDSKHGHEFPPEAMEQVRNYDPEKELLLAILSKDGQATVITMAGV